MTGPLSDRTVWFVTGSQHLYGDDVLRTVEEHARRIAEALDGEPRDPGPGRGEAGGDDPGVDPGRVPRGERRRRLRRAGRVDAHVLAGQDVDRRARRPAEAAAAPAHAVQPRPAVGRDRHGLHEPEPVGARRPGVRVHRDADAPAPQDRGRPLRRAAGAGADRHLDAGGLRLARGPRPAGRPLRRQHAPGRGHRGRQGRGPDAARRGGQRLRGRRPLGGRAGRAGRRPSTGSWPSTTSATRWPRACVPAATGALRCATRRGSRPGCAGSSTTAASGPSPTPSRTSTACRSSPVSRCSG